jgi:hypothetical protein
MTRTVRIQTIVVLATAIVIVVASSPAVFAQRPDDSPWVTVVNNNDIAPNSITLDNPDGRPFNSFNQPSVNAMGLVVFRARTRGGPPLGPPTRGIYVRDMSGGDVAASMIHTIAGGGDEVPAPNNVTYPPDELLSYFIEFPSIPRIAPSSDAVATRGNHPAVWTFNLPDGTETRAGTSGVYVNLAAGDTSSELVTGASRLGAVPGFEMFRVPGTDPPLAFDVFPGAPSITDDGTIAFKGNFTVLVNSATVAKTGVFYRRVVTADSGGADSIELVASSDTLIPNLPPGVVDVPFGSTSPPSVVGDYMVFLGLDSEEDPQYGGIYLAPMSQPPMLTTLVGIGSPVPGTRATFSRLGEGLSFDGRFVAFWGAWGTATRTLWLDCPTEGNQDRIAYCLNNVGNDFPVEVPLNQGIFVYDTQTERAHMVARTGDTFDDFVFWNFSGRVPEDEDDGEPARWRSATFVAVSGRGGATFSTAFKARSGDVDPTDHSYVDPIDGIYLGKGPGRPPILTVLDTTMDGQSLDLEAPSDSVIAEAGMERDGLRGNWLVVNASMLVPGMSEEEGMAGIYLLRIDVPPKGSANNGNQ